MYQEERTFQQTGVFGPGELVIKKPDITFRMPYSSGKALVSEDIGCAALNITDLVAELAQNPDDWSDLAARLNEPSGKAKLDELKSRLISRELYLVYSGFGGDEVSESDRYGVLTIPGIEENGLDLSNNNPHTNLYDIFVFSGFENPLDYVLTMHSNTLRFLASIIKPRLGPVDEQRLLEEVLQLVSKANRVYDIPHSPADRRISRN